MRRLLKLCAFLLSVWHASASVVPHFYCNIFRHDAVTGAPYGFTPGPQSHISREDARWMFPFDHYSAGSLYFRFPLPAIHDQLCSKMKATRPIYTTEAGETDNVEVRDVGELKKGNPVNMYRAAKMRDRWTDTHSATHDVFCFACRCNALTPIPPQVRILFAFYYI